MHCAFGAPRFARAVVLRGLRPLRVTSAGGAARAAPTRKGLERSGCKLIGVLGSGPRLMAHPLAGKSAPPELLIDVDRLTGAYYDKRPDPEIADQLVSFGTSGHRGSP